MQKPLFIADAALSDVSVTRWRNGVSCEAHDKVAEEVPIALIYNGISHAVMLATPQDLLDFALGFSLSEGILQSKSELYDIEMVTQENGIELQLTIATDCFAKLKEKRRNLVGRTGCGLCGAESLQDALRLNAIKNPREEIDALQANIHKASRAVMAKTLEIALQNMQKSQVLQQATGATHACAWANLNGEIQFLREDVGRHNAMDKLIGALAKTAKQENGFVLTSSRASVEMVQKVALAGYEILVAISAPTGLAVRVAQHYGVTLVGFLRQQQFVVYTHAERIQLD